MTVNVTQTKSYTRYSVNRKGILYEGWTYPDNSRRVWAVHCTPASVWDIPIDVRNAILEEMGPA